MPIHAEIVAGAAIGVAGVATVGAALHLLRITRRRTMTFVYMVIAGAAGGALYQTFNGHVSNAFWYAVGAGVLAAVAVGWVRIDRDERAQFERVRGRRSGPSS